MTDISSADKCVDSNLELSENLEDYLEVILELETTRKVARGKEIAEKLGIKQGSVTGTLKTLKEKELIHWEKYGYITLTSKGKTIAEAITRRHSIIKNFLISILQVDEAHAETTACKMEHAIDEITINKLVSFIEYITSCPHHGTDCLKGFSTYINKQ